MNKRQHKKHIKHQKRNAEVQAAIRAAQSSFLNCTSTMTQHFFDNFKKIENIQQFQTQHYKDILKDFADAKDAQKDVINYILNKHEDHFNLYWKNMLDAINSANQREKELNYMIFGYVILTVATVIIMLSH